MKIYFIPFLSLICSISIIAQNPVIEGVIYSTSGTLSVTVTTSTANGNYAPDNIMAIWIQDSSNKFVKTMLVYAAARKAHLINWVTSTPVGNSTDAITGATQSSHGTRTATWNGTNVSRVLVPDGNYTVKIEMTEDNTGQKVGTYNFVKGPNAVTLTPADQTCLSNISIKWTPVNTGIEGLELSKLYNIYPNPAVSTIFVSGSDVKALELYTLSGQFLLRSNEQKLNVNVFPKGIYMVKIETDKGIFTKRIIKT
jgi:hypothetical protein